MIDILATITHVTGYDENDEPVIEKLDGFHVNSTVEIDGWADYRVIPETPERVFGGVDTYFYCFADKAAFEAAADAAADVVVSDFEGVISYGLSPELTARVPKFVTMRQCRLQLLADGKLADVEANLSAIEGNEGEAARIEWATADTVQRNHYLIESIGSALGMKKREVDSLFRLATLL